MTCNLSGRWDTLSPLDDRPRWKGDKYPESVDSIRGWKTEDVTGSGLD